MVPRERARAGRAPVLEVLGAAAVVLAVPPPRAEALLPAGAVDAAPGWAQALGASPIVDVHVRYDRRVLHAPFAAGVGTPVQWVFDRTPPGARGQHLVVSLSAADDLVRAPADAVRALVLPALAALLPDAARARVVESFVTREPRATWLPAPGTERLRPPARTRLPGLALAGAWTATGWPATMESAVRSGAAAAGVALEALGAAPDVRDPRGAARDPLVPAPAAAPRAAARRPERSPRQEVVA